jgi:hypothetical protein
MLDAVLGEALPPAPIGKLITDAKIAQANIAENKGEANPKDDAALEALKGRLETNFPKKDASNETEEKKTDDATLDTLQWHMISEAPANSPKAPHIFEEKKQEKPKAEKVDLEKTARECIDDYKTPYLRTLLQAASRVTRGSSKTPEEISAFVVLAHHDLGGRNSPNNESIVTTAFAALKGQGQGISYDNVVFYGMEAPYPKINAADLIINETKKGGKVNQDDLDRTVEAALACGNVFAAVDLIQKADSLLTNPSEREADAGMSRLAGKGGVFDKAREIYTEKLIERMDGVLASIGEGSFKSLENSGNAQARKQEATKRLKERLSGKRDEWYNAQRVSRVDLRQQQLDGEHLGNLVEEVATAGQGWEQIDKKITEVAEKIADGKTANFIAAELQRRMFPEYSLEEQIERSKSEARGDYDPSRGNFQYGTFNLYENDLGFKTRDNLEMKTEDKIEVVKQFGGGLYANTVSFQENLLGNKNKNTGLRSLVQLLSEPDLTHGKLIVFDQEYRRGKFGTLSEEALLDAKRTLAQRWVAGTSFLHTIAENPEGRRILATEFGFGEITNPNRFDKVQEALEKMFPNVVDKDSGVTIYEDALHRSQGDGGEQGVEDAGMTDKIIKARQREAESQATTKKIEARKLTGELGDRLSTEQHQLIFKQESLKTPITRQQEINTELEQLTRRRTAVDATTVVKNQLAKLINGGALTAEEKTSKLGEIDKQSADLSRQLAEVVKQIEELGGVQIDSNLSQLNLRIQNIEKLRSTV